MRRQGRQSPDNGRPRPSEHALRCDDDPFGLEAKLPLQLLERRGGAESLHADDLSGLPLWALKQACQDISRGKVEGCSLDFPPAAPRLRSIADEIVAPVLDESFALHAILTAPVEHEPSPEERARVAH